MFKRDHMCLNVEIGKKDKNEIKAEVVTVRMLVDLIFPNGMVECKHSWM